MIRVMIKGFLLDYDGVITLPNHGDNTSVLLARAMGVSHDGVRELWMEFWPKYIRGKASENELWEAAETRAGKKIPVDQRNIWLTWEQLQPLPEMRELVKTLQAAGYPVGLLTNITPLAKEDVRKHGGYDGFDFLVHSCDVGFAKPDKQIYQLAMSHFSGAKAEEIVFVDDREKNLVPARELGMQTVFAMSPPQVVADITKLAGL
jgi:putative hydrolase of the HAD superfamily